MKRVVAILAGITLFGAACSFYWNGPVEVRAKDGRKYDCLKITTDDQAPFGYLRCHLSGSVPYIDIPWKEVAGLTTK